MELTGDRLRVSRTLSELDEAVIDFVDLLEDCGIDYVIVSGYVSILTGRSRATEDIDTVLEPMDEDTTNAFVEALEDAGYWGMAMPLEEMYPMLSEGERIRVAEAGEMIPNFELWFASNDVEREALANAITAAVGDARINVSAIELQIAYKLRLAQHAGSTRGKDFEDALHLFETFEESLNTEALDTYVRDLGVREYYDQLRRA